MPTPVVLWTLSLGRLMGGAICRERILSLEEREVSAITRSHGQTICAGNGYDLISGISSPLNLRR